VQEQKVYAQAQQEQSEQVHNLVHLHFPLELIHSAVFEQEQKVCEQERKERYEEEVHHRKYHRPQTGQDDWERQVCEREQ